MVEEDQMLLVAGLLLLLLMMLASLQLTQEVERESQLQMTMQRRRCCRRWESLSLRYRPRWQVPPVSLSASCPPPPHAPDT